MKPMDKRAERLVKEAWDLTQVIAALRRDLAKVEGQLDEYFPKSGPVEALTCATGSAHRIEHEEIFIEPDQVEEAMAMLGSKFSTYFCVVSSCRPKPAALALLSDSNSKLGEEMRGFLNVRRERLYSFSPARKIIDVPVAGGRG